MHTIVITGSQSGMGLTVREHFSAQGAKVIGIDLPGKGADVEADLSTAAGRAAAVAQTLVLCGGVLDGVVANAGVDMPGNLPLMLQVNYFGAIEILQGLQPALARAGRAGAAATVSDSVAISPGIPDALVNELMAGGTDAISAVAAALAATPNLGYQVSKMALARWIRQHAATKEWAGAGITLNGVAPGPVMTPLLAHDLEDPQKGPMIRALPQPLGEFTTPQAVADLYEFLLSPKARYIVGQIIMIDGGIEAAWRANDWPCAWTIERNEFLARYFSRKPA
jgi:NAD(P)-dependent dehydrogenase (short-subunit alcohol dehydrogenase family)